MSADSDMRLRFIVFSGSPRDAVVRRIDSTCISPDIPTSPEVSCKNLLCLSHEHSMFNETDGWHITWKGRNRCPLGQSTITSSRTDPVTKHWLGHLQTPKSWGGRLERAGRSACHRLTPHTSTGCGEEEKRSCSEGIEHDVAENHSVCGVLLVG